MGAVSKSRTIQMAGRKGKVGENLLDRWQKIIGEDQQLGCCTKEYFYKLFPGKSKIQCRMNSAKLGTGKEQIQVFISITSQNGDSVAFLNALCFEPVCQAIGTAIRFPKGQSPLRIFSCVYKS
jgi:hypothetical protein